MKDKDVHGGAPFLKTLPAGGCINSSPPGHHSFKVLISHFYVKIPALYTLKLTHSCVVVTKLCIYFFIEDIISVYKTVLILDGNSVKKTLYYLDIQMGDWKCLTQIKLPILQYTSAPVLIYVQYYKEES